ncbi:MAG: hypothetical protein J6M34_05030 [Clostridia bacterium]|nr:hypothetical protein [Clostridia bacterium]
MRSKQNIGWVLLGVAVCLAVGLTLLAVLPAWDGMGKMSMLEAIIYSIKNGTIVVE